MANTPQGTEESNVFESQDLQRLIQEKNDYYYRNKELRIVLVGKTGKGKSSTANTILGKKFFESKAAARAVTTKCQTAKISRFERDVMIVDTPGFFETALSQPQIEAEVKQVVPICSPGIHAFLIVLSIERHTDEEQRTIDAIVNAFGQELYNHSIVVFTNRDKLENDNISLDEFISNAPVPLKTLLGNCQQQYIAINNQFKIASPEREKEAEVLMNYIFAMLKKNDHKYYNDNMFERAEKNLFRNSINSFRPGSKHDKLAESLKKASLKEKKAEEKKNRCEEKLQKLEEKKELNMKQNTEQKKSDEKEDEIQALKKEMEMQREKLNKSAKAKADILVQVTNTIINERDKSRENESDKYWYECWK